MLIVLSCVVRLFDSVWWILLVGGDVQCFCLSMLICVVFFCMISWFFVICLGMLIDGILIRNVGLVGVVCSGVVVLVGLSVQNCVGGELYVVSVSMVSVVVVLFVKLFMCVVIVYFLVCF